PARRRRDRRRAARPHRRAGQPRCQHAPVGRARIRSQTMARAEGAGELPIGPLARVRARADEPLGAELQRGRSLANPPRRDRDGHARRLDMLGWKSVFLPNSAVTSTAMRITIAVQTGLFLLIWWFSPLEVLPTPYEVVCALKPLWLYQGLGAEL